MAEGVQPAPNEGEGQGTQPNEAEGLYQQFLDGIPEQFHGTLTERLKAQDADVTKRFQSHSETWKPYEDLGVNEVDPEALGGLLTLGQAFEAAAGGDKEAQQAVQEWVGENLDFLGGNEGSEGEPNGEESLFDLSPEKLQELVGSQITDAVSPLLERLDQQDQEKATNEIESEISEGLSTLKEQNPNLDDDDLNDILILGSQVAPKAQSVEEVLSAGFDKFQSLVAKGENGLFGQKLNQPVPAEAGGTPNTSAPQITSFADAEKSAREKLRVAQQT